MGKDKKADEKKLNYLMFCGKCGLPKHIPIHIIKTVFPLAHGVFCEECEHSNPIPGYLRTITDELSKGDII